MKTNENRQQTIARILRNWLGSDSAEEAPPNTVAEEIDHVYADYLDSLPAQTLAIRRGQEESERRAA